MDMLITLFDYYTWIHVKKNHTVPHKYVQLKKKEVELIFIC